MAVRTKLLASGRRTDATLATVYEVPAGETAIIKRVHIANLSSSIDATVGVFMDAGTFDNTRWATYTLGPLGSTDQETWQVLGPGATVGIQGPGTPQVNFWLSGTELEGVAD